jgi:polysaccharide export outer membrane protein
MSKCILCFLIVWCAATVLFAQQAETKSPSEPAATVPAPAAPSAADEKSSKSKKPKKTDKPGPASSASGPDQTPFVIGPEDTLYVRVWGVPEVTGAVDVRPDGMISMQLIGEVKAAGLTPEELRGEVTKRLTSTIKQPEVNIQVMAVHSKKYYIAGEVNHPGPVVLTGRITVLEALMNAGGFRDFANKKKIYVLRGTTRYPFNFNDVSKGKHQEQNIWIQNGDTIFVP